MASRTSLACWALLAGWTLAGTGCTVSNAIADEASPAPTASGAASSATDRAGGASPTEIPPAPLPAQAPGPGDARGAPAPASTGAPGPAPAPPPATSQLSAPCQKMLEQIRTLEGGVPVIFENLKRTPAEIRADLVACRDLCKRFLAECTGAEACEVKGTLVRMELADLLHHQQELDKSHPDLTAEARAELLRAHVQGLLEQARAAARECAEGSAARLTALRCVVDLLSRSGDPEGAIQAVDELLKQYPDYELRATLHLQKALSYLAQRRYDQAARYLREVVKKNPDDVSLVRYYDKLLDALLGTGDLEGVEELVHLMRAQYPEIMKKLSPGSMLHNQYEQWLCMSLFWLGFARMALGDNDGALETFKQHLAEYEDRMRKRQEEGRPVSGGSDICTITVDYRTRDMIDVIEKFYNVVPTRCFDLGDLWATEKRLEWKNLRGKYVAAVFRQPGDPRSASFLQEVDRQVKANESLGLVGVTLTHTAGQPGPGFHEALKQRIRQDLEKLGVSLPAGADPDSQGQGLFREVHATVGTASFVLFDRDGKIVWFLADPRDIDRGVLRRVLERVLAPGTGAGKPQESGDRK